jgi:hypothetical protein
VIALCACFACPAPPVSTLARQHWRAFHSTGREYLPANTVPAPAGLLLGPRSLAVSFQSPWGTALANARAPKAPEDHPGQHVDSRVRDCRHACGHVGGGCHPSGVHAAVRHRLPSVWCSFHCVRCFAPHRKGSFEGQEAEAPLYPSAATRTRSGRVSTRTSPASTRRTRIAPRQLAPFMVELFTAGLCGRTSFTRSPQRSLRCGLA